MKIHQRLAVLTPRELQIAALIADGINQHEIAAVLEISVRTYDTHRQHIMSKLQLDGNVALVRLAIATGLVPVPTYAEAA